MGCGCGGGGRRPAHTPKLAINNAGKVPENVAKLHPNVVHMQNIQKLSEEKRKIERLKREQLLKALSRP